MLEIKNIILETETRLLLAYWIIESFRFELEYSLDITIFTDQQ